MQHAGVTLIEVYATWHWEAWEPVFGNIFKIFYSMKEENSYTGPSDMIAKEEFCQKWKRIGIQLNPEKLTKNPAAVVVSKTIINSIWGKFGQKLIRDVKQFINHPSQLKTVMIADDNGSIDDLQLFICTKNTVLATWKNASLDMWNHESGSLCRQVHSKNFNVSTAVAGLTTAIARTILHEQMIKSPKSICYCDTDSIFTLVDEHNFHKFQQDAGDMIGNWVPENYKLGDTFEQAKPKLFQHFLCWGAKSYLTGKEEEGKIIIKQKGVSLNIDNRKKLTKEQIQSLIFSCYIRPFAFGTDPEYKESNFEEEQVLEENIPPNEIFFSQEKMQLRIPEFSVTLISGVKRIKGTWGSKRIGYEEHITDEYGEEQKRISTLPWGYKNIEKEPEEQDIVPETPLFDDNRHDEIHVEDSDMEDNNIDINNNDSLHLATSHKFIMSAENLFDE
jgi:hypothetical protein